MLGRHEYKANQSHVTNGPPIARLQNGTSHIIIAYSSVFFLYMLKIYMLI